MLSWDDFRIVKAIADCGSPPKRRSCCGLTNQPCFENSDRSSSISMRGVQRSRSALTLTPRGEDMVRLASAASTGVGACMASNAKTPNATPFVTGVVPADEIAARSGLQFLTDMAKGVLPQPPMCATLGFHLVESRRRLCPLRRRAGIPPLQSDRHGARRLCRDAAGFRAGLRASSARWPRARPGPRWS